jgi:hypothetical protein
VTIATKTPKYSMYPRASIRRLDGRAEMASDYVEVRHAARQDAQRLQRSSALSAESWKATAKGKAGRMVDKATERPKL